MPAHRFCPQWNKNTQRRSLCEVLNLFKITLTIYSLLYLPLSSYGVVHSLSRRNIDSVLVPFLVSCDRHHFLRPSASTLCFDTNNRRGVISIAVVASTPRLSHDTHSITIYSLAHMATGSLPPDIAPNITDVVETRRAAWLLPPQKTASYCG